MGRALGPGPVRGGELPLMEWAVALQVEKADRETLEQMYGALTRLLVHALSPAGAGTDLARALPRDGWRPGPAGGDRRNQCQFNVSVGHSAGWFAVRSRQIALGQVCS